MNEPFQLVTHCAFKGKDYLVQMCVFSSKKLELTITDKLMAEDWQCEYDSSYIEALTHKTGNFKNFEVFVMMLKSGLLKTSDCITLDLLTLKDLEELRSKKIITSHQNSRALQTEIQNKRYLILTYSVEFDRIHYPLPLDYCGPPDPTVLQSNIRRLEAEVQRLKQKTVGSNSHCLDANETRKLKEKIESLIEDNSFLSSEIRRLNKILAKTTKPTKGNQILQNTLKKLEEQVLQEKNHFHHIIWKLKEENRRLKNQIEELRTSENCLKLRLKKYALAQAPKRMFPNSISPERGLDWRRNIRGERPFETKNGPRRLVNKTRSRSSSDSGVDKPNKLDPQEKELFSPGKLKTALRGSAHLPPSRKSSGEQSRHSSYERATAMETEALKPLTRINRQCRVRRRDSSNGSDARTGRLSRESSLSSRESSKRSRDSRCSSRGSGDHGCHKKRSSRVILPDRDDLKFSVSDLETRIHALQRILSEGLNF